MKKYILSSFFILFATLAFSQDGKSLFQSNCATCHTIGNGKLIGPDLKGITANLSDSYLMEWIKSSQKLIDKKNPTAVAIFKEFNEVPMTQFSYLSDDQVKSIIAYVKAGGEESSATASDSTSSAPVATASTTAPTSTVSVSTPSTETPESTNQPVKTINPHSFFSVLWMSIVALFVLIIILVLTGTIKSLSNALKEKDKNNEDGTRSGDPEK